MIDDCRKERVKIYIFAPELNGRVTWTTYGISAL